MKKSFEFLLTKKEDLGFSKKAVLGNNYVYNLSNMA
jgi:hypothetical protein